MSPTYIPFSYHARSVTNSIVCVTNPRTIFLQSAKLILLKDRSRSQGTLKQLFVDLRLAVETKDVLIFEISILIFLTMYM